jgi:hypothetical protein
VQKVKKKVLGDLFPRKDLVFSFGAPPSFGLKSIKQGFYSVLRKPFFFTLRVASPFTRGDVWNTPDA